MADVVFRAFTPDLEVRAASKGGDGRTIVGIAVPYNRPTVIDARLTEQFARGAFDHQIRPGAVRPVPFARNHLPLGGTLIGRSTLLRDDPSGLYGEWRVADTAAGNETLELVKMGALDQLSIGFREKQNRRLPGGVIERVTADLKEVAVVLEGAYDDGAAVTSVRRPTDHVPGCQCEACLASYTDRLDMARQVLARLPVLPAVDA